MICWVYLFVPNTSWLATRKVAPPTIANFVAHLKYKIRMRYDDQWIEILLHTWREMPYWFW
jgi:hypothetical protein